MKEIGNQIYMLLRKMENLGEPNAIALKEDKFLDFLQDKEQSYMGMMSSNEYMKSINIAKDQTISLIEYAVYTMKLDVS